MILVKTVIVKGIKVPYPTLVFKPNQVFISFKNSTSTAFIQVKLPVYSSGYRNSFSRVSSKLKYALFGKTEALLLLKTANWLLGLAEFFTHWPALCERLILVWDFTQLAGKMPPLMSLWSLGQHFQNESSVSFWFLCPIKLLPIPHISLTIFLCNCYGFSQYFQFHPLFSWIIVHQWQRVQANEKDKVTVKVQRVTWGSLCSCVTFCVTT